MDYGNAIKTIRKNHTCPFCHDHEHPENILQQGRYFMVLPARAPYTKHHLVIVPKRHVNFLGTLTHTELLEMYRLIDIRVRKLHTKYKDVSLLLRDGLVKDKIIKKSINHLHMHLLPNVGIHITTASRQSPSNRIFFDDQTYTKIATAYRKTFL